MVTETDRNKARSAVVSAYHALDCVTIPLSFLHALADAAVDAVSTDAEPVAWIVRNPTVARTHSKTQAHKSSKEALYPVSRGEDAREYARLMGGECLPLYTHSLEAEQEENAAEGKCQENDGCPTEKAVLQRFWRRHHNADPVKTAPAVAVKALRWRKYGNQHGTGWQGIGAIGYLQYIVDRSSDGEEGWFWRKRGFDTEDEAKAAVQAHYDAAILSALSAQVQDVAETLETYYQRQIEWSRGTFGPALRTKGIIDHIKKELREIEADPHDLSEWVDVVILAMDGFWRHGGSAEDLFKALIAKQKKNMARTWPDWRTMSEDSAIEHDRSKDVASPASKHGDAE